MIFWGKGVLLKPPGGTLKLSLVLICRWCIYDIATSTAWDTSRMNGNLRSRQLEPSQSSTDGIPVKLNLSQLCRHAKGKDWDDQCCWPLNLFSYQKSISGSIGCHVAGASGAYENQALQWHKWRKDFLQFEINKLLSLFPNIFCYFPKLCTAKSYAELTVLFLPTLKCNSSIFSDLPGNRQP